MELPVHGITKADAEFTTTCTGICSEPFALLCIVPTVVRKHKSYTLYGATRAACNLRRDRAFKNSDMNITLLSSKVDTHAPVRGRHLKDSKDRFVMPCGGSFTDLTLEEQVA